MNFYMKKKNVKKKKVLNKQGINNKGFESFELFFRKREYFKIIEKYKNVKCKFSKKWVLRKP